MGQIYRLVAPSGKSYIGQTRTRHPSKEKRSNESILGTRAGRGSGAMTYRRLLEDHDVTAHAFEGLCKQHKGRANEDGSE